MWLWVGITCFGICTAKENLFRPLFLIQLVAGVDALQIDQKMQNFEDVEERDGQFLEHSIIHCAHSSLAFRRCAFVLECLAVIEDRSDTDCGPNLRIIHTAQAKR